MNTEEKSKFDIKGTRQEIAKVEQAMANRSGETSHQEFAVAKRAIRLTSRKAALKPRDGMRKSVRPAIGIEASVALPLRRCNSSLFCRSRPSGRRSRIEGWT